MNRVPVRYAPASELQQKVHTGALQPAPAEAAEQQNFFDALRGVTPALIATGIAIGIASGIGTTIGSTLGTLLLERFHLRNQPRRTRRAARS